MISVKAYSEIIILIVTFFSLLGFLAYTLVGTRKTVTIISYGLGHLLMMLYVLFLAYTLITGNQHYKIIDYMMILIIIMMCYFYVVFAYQYFSEKDMPIHKIIKWSAVPIIPSLFLGINYLITNWLEGSKLIGYFNIFIGMAMIFFFLMGIYFIYRYRMQVKRHFRMRQSLFYMISFVLPILMMSSLIAFYFRLSTLYISSVCFVVSILVNYYGYRYRLLDDIPGLLDYVIDHMKDGILVIDKKKNIIDYNEALMKSIIGRRNISDFNSFIEGLTPLLLDSKELEMIQLAVESQEDLRIVGDIEIQADESIQRFHYNVAKIKSRNDVTIASLISFHDITEIQTLHQAIEEKNTQLKIANDQLAGHVNNVNELYLEEERKKLMDDVNEIIGNSMTEVLALLEVLDLMVLKNQDEDEIIDLLDNTSDRVREVLKEVRESVVRFKEA